MIRCSELSADTGGTVPDYGYVVIAHCFSSSLGGNWLVVAATWRVAARNAASTGVK